jgi:pimeloyl-ACP methyl ester carboxylesterase
MTAMGPMPTVDHHSAKLNGIKLHWVTAGSGPPVYLLGGFPETWFGWRKQIGFLADSFTVVAPDLRGYGATDTPTSGYDKRTMARDLVALMDHLGHERIALVGHDRGARVATRFAKDHSARVHRLVVMDNVPTRILEENPGNSGVRAGGWFFTFFSVRDIPGLLIAGHERELLSGLNWAIELRWRFVANAWVTVTESLSWVGEGLRICSDAGSLALSCASTWAVVAAVLDGFVPARSATRPPGQRDAGRDRRPVPGGVARSAGRHRGSGRLPSRPWPLGQRAGAVRQRRCGLATGSDTVSIGIAPAVRRGLWGRAHDDDRAHRRELADSPGLHRRVRLDCCGAERVGEAGGGLG